MGRNPDPDAEIAEQELATAIKNLGDTLREAFESEARERCDGTCPRGRYCPEHGDLPPDEGYTEDEMTADDQRAQPDWML